MPRLPPLSDISNEISNETQMKAKWATLKNSILHHVTTTQEAAKVLAEMLSATVEAQYKIFFVILKNFEGHVNDKKKKMKI